MNEPQSADDVALCGLLIDSYEGCYCELPAGHDAFHECACGARHIGYPELNDGGESA